MSPNLSLSYSSSGDNGPLGLGWSLAGMGSLITRCPTTPVVDGSRGVVSYNSSDRYCLDGQELVGVSGTYGGGDGEYRTFNDQFAKIVSVDIPPPPNADGSPGTPSDTNSGPDTFIVYRKDGRVDTYQARTATRQAGESVSLKDDAALGQAPWFTSVHDTKAIAGTMSTPRVAWELTSEDDRSGNEIRYNYADFLNPNQPSGRERLLTKITYTWNSASGAGSGIANAAREVDLAYESRPDATFSWVSGVQYLQTERLKTITMQAPDPSTTKAVRTYHLSYLATGGNTGRTRSMLWQVQECGANGGCLPAKQFTWAASGLPTFKTTQDLGPLPINPLTKQSGNADADASTAPVAEVADLDGSGMDSLLFNPGGSSPNDKVLMGSRDSSGNAQPLNNSYSLSGAGSFPSTLYSSLYGAQAKDILGYGRAQVALRYDGGPNGPNSTIATRKQTKILQWDAASKTFKDTNASIDNGGATGSDWEEYADTTGNGKLDRVFSGPTASGQKTGVQSNTGQGTFSAATTASDLTGACARHLVASDSSGVSHLQEEFGASLAQSGEFSTPVDPGCGMGNTLGTGPAAIMPDDQRYGVPHVYTGQSNGLDYIYAFKPNALGDTRFFHGDFLGDGLQDTLMIRSNTTSTTQNTFGDGGHIIWNTGSGQHFDAVNSPDLGIPHDDLMDIRIGDLTGNGRDDIVAFYNKGLSVNHHDFTKFPAADSTELVQDPNNNVDMISIFMSNGDGTFQREDISTSAGTPRIDGRAFSQLGDFSGTGKLDILKDDGNLKIMHQDPSQPDRITVVTDEGAPGNRQVVKYDQQWTDHPELMSNNTCAWPEICLRKGMPVVRELDSYENGYVRASYFSYGDPVTDTRTGFVGFGTVRVWDPVAQSETVTTYDVRHTDNNVHTLALLPKEVTTAVVITPVPVDKQASTPSATARVTDTVNTYTYTQLNANKSYTVSPNTSTTTTTEGPVTIDWKTSLAGTTDTVHLAINSATQNAIRIQTSTQAFDSYGNQTDQKVSTTNGTSQEIATGMVAPDTANWLISLPDHTTVTSTGAGANPETATRTTNYKADSKGRPTTVTTQQGTADAVTVTTTLDDTTGMPTKVTTSQTGLADRVVHTEYNMVFAGQPNEFFLPSQTWTERTAAPLYQPSVWMAVHPAYGITVASEDINGIRAATYWDDLGRPVKTTADHKPDTTISYAQQTDANGKMIGTSVTSSAATGPAGSGHTNDTTTVTDQIGRTVSATTTGFDGTAVTTTTSYDALGRTSSQSRPTAAGKTVYASQLSYDNLNRPTSTTSPDGKTTTYAYPDAFTTTVTDPLQHQKRTITDVNGRTVESDVSYTDSNGKQRWAATKTTYHPFDLTATVTDDHGNVTSTDYNVYGRPKSVTDPDHGGTTTTYYPTGEVNTVTHTSTGNTSTTSYDDLGRKTKVIDHDAATNKDATTTFTWDTATNWDTVNNVPGKTNTGIGQMASTTSPDNITTTSYYDTDGRPQGTDYTDVATNTTYHTLQSYDAQSRPDTRTYPAAPGRNNLAVQNTYNDYGYQNYLTDVTAGQNPTTLSHTVTENTDRATTGASLGPIGAITLANTYDPVTGRLTDSTAGKSLGGGTIQDLSYTYYDNGLVHTRNENDPTTPNRDETFSYDEWNRLTGWDLTNNNSPKTTTTYTYDTIGNLTNTSNTTGITPNETRSFPTASGAAQPHAMTSDTNPNGNGAESYQYDAQGRQTSGGGRTSTYTAFDLPHTVTDANNKVTTFAYDAFGTRVKQTNPDGSTTFTVPGLFEDRTDANKKHTYVYYLPGVGQAVYNGTTTTVEYTLKDALGSTTKNVDSNGSVQQAYNYDPFGARTNADGTRPAATPGDITHGFTGQEHNDNLRLINMNGRVYDPIEKQFLSADPVASNHPYSYVNSSPLNQTDLTGFDGEEALGLGTDTSGYAPSENSVPDGATFNPAWKYTAVNYIEGTPDETAPPTPSEPYDTYVAWRDSFNGGFVLVGQNPFDPYADTHMAPSYEWTNGQMLHFSLTVASLAVLPEEAAVEETGVAIAGELDAAASTQAAAAAATESSVPATEAANGIFKYDPNNPWSFDEQLQTWTTQQLADAPGVRTFYGYDPNTIPEGWTAADVEGRMTAARLDGDQLSFDSPTAADLKQVAIEDALSSNPDYTDVAHLNGGHGLQNGDNGMLDPSHLESNFYYNSMNYMARGNVPTSTFNMGDAGQVARFQSDLIQGNPNFLKVGGYCYSTLSCH